MSEMHRPTLPFAAPDHDQHDPLLVAQLVAGDPLEPKRAAEGQAWLANCSECARLASDLGAVRAAVANEPVPPRRRDFRLTAEQAEDLQGHAVMRFLRGLALPRARAFAPAAAGLLSVGLVFVVAGYAWPEGGSLSVGTDADVVPAALEQRAVPSADANALEFFTTHPDALEEALSNQVGAPPRSESMRKAIEAEALDGEGAAEPVADLEDGAAAAPEAGAVLEAESTSQDEAERAVPAPADAGETTDDLARGAAAGRALDGADQEVQAPTADEVDGVDLTTPVGATEASAAEPDTADSATAELATVVEGSDDAGLERWLVLVGVLLAVAGGALLLLGWLSRRASDPLLR